MAKVLEMGDVQDENTLLKGQLEELQAQVSHLSHLSTISGGASESVLTPRLLEEKNSQIDETREELTQLKVSLSVWG